MIWKLFELIPTPEEAIHADVEAVRELIEPLGLAPKRAPMLIRFSKEYVEKKVCHSPTVLACVPQHHKRSIIASL